MPDVASRSKRTLTDTPTPAGPPAHILIVDDDPFIRQSLAEILRFAGHTTLEAADGKAALDLLGRHPVDLILLDLELPRIGGLDVLRRVQAERPHIPVVIISGKGTIRIAVEATKLGAYDFLEKPPDARRTLLTIRNALEKRRLERERDRLLDEARARYRMVGTSPAMQTVYRLIDRAAGTQAKVLVIGESGTGKEMVARAIHHNSPRRAGPFVALNCAAIPEELIESQLFGHEKGAFTGANRAHPGKFEQAHGGTLFLDEIGDMSLMTQAKVLRVLETGEVDRLGSTRPVPVDVRLIAATHKNLEAEIAEGNFREDLYYRLNIITITLPPLRERTEDIPALATHFLAHFAEENGLPVKTLTTGALTLLLSHDWPGNVRQLRNVIERLVVLTDGPEIDAQAVRLALRRPDPVHDAGLTNLREAREAFEREHIRRMLLAYDGRINETAEALGIDRSHLWKKMKRYGLSCD
ncbi:MAG: sigma-54-dependent Fis family transcriptional regulator [Pirellulaceae bacterium]|nr:MAG: sigma-54-dependent Fis family transcriptional regulator [Pirellulaceae bacterium]